MVASFSLILVNDNFFAFAFFNNCCGYSSTLYSRASDLHLTVVNSQNLIESNSFTCSSTESLNIDYIALGNLILLTLPPVAIIAYI